jgi:oligopeptidase B
MYTRNLTIIHEEKVVGAVPYNSKMYESKRLYATSYDGTAVPVSIVYRKDLLGKNQEEYHPNPLLLHAYGAYGACANPRFSTNRLSLLDRGFIYAVAHTRGGADMGNAWYDDGKLLKKKNTFNDFCSVAEYLIKEGYTIPSKLAIYGRSAGGLLIGAAINMRPNLFQAALTEVPFVDVINTMFNSSIPWTAFEFEVKLY